MTSWLDHLADLDRTAFSELADDVAAILSRAGAPIAVVPVMRESVERTSSRQGLAIVEQVDVVRVSVQLLHDAAPGVTPRAGDLWILNGQPSAVRGTPFRDDKSGGRDWLCPVDPA